MNVVGSVSGQSNYDICLGSTYGTLDDFIKLLSDNGISNSKQIITQYSYNQSISNTNNVGNIYATNIPIVTEFIPSPLRNDDGDILLNDDGSPLYADDAF